MNKRLQIKTAILFFFFAAVGAHAQTPSENSALVSATETKSTERDFSANAAEIKKPMAFNRAFNQPKAKVEAGSFPARQQTYVRPTREQRLKRYLSDAFGVPALIGSTFGATINQIGNDPPEWRRTASGFGKRFASSYGTNAIRNSISFGISETFKLENRFEKSGQKDFGKRLKHVFLGSYTTRTKTGKRLPDFPHFIGTYSAAIIANETWMPDRFSYKDGLRDGTVSLGIRFGVNLLREFIFPK